MAKYVGFRKGKVHESHVISEYYCGGCGWPVTDHDSFCPECGGAFRESDADCTEEENAKLRELVWDMWQFTGTACKKYPRLFDPSAQGGQMVQLNALDCFEQRMR